MTLHTVSPDPVEHLAVRLMLTGCGPKPVFTRRGAVNWLALCPCVGAFDGHSVTVQRALDGSPLLSCQHGAREARILDELHLRVADAEQSSYPDVMWGCGS